MSHLKHLPQNWQSPIKVVAVVAGREITHELMRCCCGCPWCSGLWCLSEVSAGLLPEPAWSFMASLHWLVYGFILCSSSCWQCIDDQAFSYFLLLLTSVALVTESIPTGPQETWLILSLLHLLWPADQLISKYFTAQYEEAIKSLLEVFSSITIFNCLQKICVSGVIRLCLFWLKINWFDMNGLTLLSRKATCLNTVFQPRRP